MRSTPSRSSPVEYAAKGDQLAKRGSQQVNVGAVIEDDAGAEGLLGLMYQSAPCNIPVSVRSAPPAILAFRVAQEQSRLCWKAAWRDVSYAQVPFENRGGCFATTVI
jgi:hypothetical protein